MEVDEEADKFYAVARGKVVGIFTDYSEVKNHVSGFWHFFASTLCLRNSVCA